MSYLAGLSMGWGYSLEDILGLVLVAGIIGLYSLMFAVTERNWRGWLASACISFAVMAWLIAASLSAPVAEANNAGEASSHINSGPV